MSQLTDRINRLSPEQRERLLQKAKPAAAEPVPGVPYPRTSDGSEFPLSFAQQRFWFLYQWEPDSPAYSLPCVFKLDMAVDAAVLEESIATLMQRHEILRTTYEMRGDEGIQIIHPAPFLKLEIQDLRHHPAGQREECMEEHMNAVSLQPFRLEEELPLKAYLYRLDTIRYVLLLNLHHISCDGWSVAVIMREIQQAYTSLRHGRKLELLPLSLQYADYALWQRQHMAGDVLSRHQSYWINKLQGELPVLELAADKPRPPVRTFKGSAIIKNYPHGLYTRLQQFSAEEDVTVYMTLLSAYFLLLHQYSGQTDLIVGSAFSGRNRVEIEQNVGLFVNTLPIRLQMDANASFRETVQQVKQLSLEALEHQDLPLEKIMELAAVERDTSHNPLFQTLFVLQNMHVGGGDNPDLQLHFNGSRNTGSSKFDLSFSATWESVQAEFSSELFHRSTIETMLEHYFNLLERAISDPERPAVHIPMLSERERTLILRKWSGSGRRTEQRADFHIVSSLEKQASLHPDIPAVVCEEITYTYESLNRRANILAHALRLRGIGPECAIGILMERSAEVVIAIVAVLKSGAVYVPLDPSYPKERLQHMINESGMSVLITERSLAATAVENGLVHLMYYEDFMQTDSENTHNPDLLSGPWNLMYMIFTSGSTGLPKGVGIELGHFHNYIQGIIEHLRISGSRSFCLASTFAADLGTTNLFGALCTGGTLHVLTYERSCDPDGTAAYFSQHRIDIMKVVPSHFEALLEAEQPEAIIPHQILILAGEGLSHETVSRIRKLRPDCSIENHYGPTETTVSSLAFHIPADMEASPGLVPIGYPLPNKEVYILDAYMNPLPPGVPGELYIGGVGVARGYIQKPKLNGEKFVRNPFGERGERLYKSGDRARFLRDGSVEILGRMDRQIKIRGFRIELGEIEAVIGSFPFVKSAAVVLKTISPKEKRIAAYVVFDQLSAEPVALAALKQGLRDRLPEYMIPAQLTVMESLPLNPSGKVNMPLLTAMDVPLLAVTRDSNAQLPQTETEQRIYEVWREVLGAPHFSIDDNFFELGGESFKALKVVRRLANWISIMDFFRYPTIRSLAGYMDQGKPEEQRRLHRLSARNASVEEKLTLICIPYAGGSAITYQPLAAHMPPDAALYAVDIPGHDYSRKEEALLPLDEAARLCVLEIQRLGARKIALYGHCVGGALTLEIARQLEREKLPLAGIFLGGSFPVARIPGKLFNWFSSIFPSDRTMSNKSYHEFLKALGGFTDVEDGEERDFMIRCLRHDARESENYYTAAYADEEFHKLQAPIVCVIGQKDRATQLYEERYQEWGYFSDQVELTVIPKSGHYFIKHQADQLSKTITDRLIHRKVWENTGESGHPEIKAQRAPFSSINLSTGSQASVSPNLRVFFTVVFGQLMSILGSGLTGISLGVWVFSQTQSVADFAAISSASLIPGILVLPFAGAIVDRYDRRLVMLFSDLFMALPILWLAVMMMTGSMEIWHIYLASAIGSVSRSFHRPAFMASIAQIIPKQYLGHANGLVQLAGSTSEMISPLAGVALYSLIGLTNIFILDVVSFSIAIATLLIVRFPNTLFHKREESFLREVLMGWKFIVRRPSLLYMIAFFFVGNILFGGASVLIQPMVLSFGTPGDLAAATMFGAIGAFAGALCMSLWGGTKRRAVGMIGFVIAEGFFMIVTGFRENLVLTALGLFGVWFAVTLVNTHWQSLIQSKVGLELQGRVLATNQMIAMSSMPIGYWLSGVLADSVFAGTMNSDGALSGIFGPLIGIGPGREIGLLMIGIGLLTMIWATAGFNFKPLLNMEDRLEDAIPGSVMEDRDTLQAQLDQQMLQHPAANKSVML